MIKRAVITHPNRKDRLPLNKKSLQIEKI